ncbi:lipoyl(octanoyl) transferase LipB [Natronospira bacteriovora]|uniref:Octanoyltransferase n=1 Tax=Natronospira bacteriovora TaxID=3069753 RepID=A0ABU0W422_9GAMM|nr:lipoyl(octanoyl) transferase LipB [Natronospira sp. AB-CW4]MDQ2068765.1 lipoyl(octanoyl) transferase LipB [Natronospira sp. AB-CW4]
MASTATTSQDIPPPEFRELGRRDFDPVWEEMKQWTLARSGDESDRIWQVEHPPVFTLGLAGKREHVLAPGDIPVIDIDRGGQVTYHGPGQLVVYPLINLRRLKLGVRALVEALEQAVIDTLAGYGIDAANRRDAPGVYVEGRKIAALGLRVRNGCTYHGLAFNVNMDLEPFQRINPCGYEGLEVTQVTDLGGPADPMTVWRDLQPHLLRRLGYPTP